MRQSLALVFLLWGCSASIEPELDASTDVEDGGARPDGSVDARPDALVDARVDARVDSTAPPADTKVDTGVATTDTGVKDSYVAPTSCAKPLPSTFACVAPTAKKGKRTCTEAMIQAYVPACFGAAASSSKCGDVKKKYPACDACILTDWIDGTRIDIAACLLAISPTSPCASSVHCGYDCLDVVCASCSAAAGSGKSGVSEKYDCYNDQSKSTGQCWSKGMSNYSGCAGDAKFSLCFPATTADLVPFFRGACRDGGSWANALSP